MVTVITCTGSRPEAFKLCVNYMKSQTYNPDIQWIIVNDDNKSSDLKPLLTGLPAKIKPELYQGPEMWKPGRNTHKSNMSQALANVKGDIILFMEDDDWYSPHFISTMVSYLQFCPIVGEANAKYYNLKIPGWRRMQNYYQASLCQTGIRKELLPLLDSTLRMDGNIDGNLWEYAHKAGHKAVLFTNYDLCIGMKGLPGRVGIGIGHQNKGYIVDNNLAILRRWLGDDSIPYVKFIKEDINVKIQASKAQEPKVPSQKGSSNSSPGIVNKKGISQNQAKKSELTQRDQTPP